VREVLISSVAAGNNWIEATTVAATRPMTCVVTATVNLRTVNPPNAGAALVSVAKRKDAEAWSAKGIWSAFAAPHPVQLMLFDYHASSTTQIDMNAGETWALGCAMESVSGGWVGLGGWCTTSWICH
jgi:hypothetical protein